MRKPVAVLAAGLIGLGGSVVLLSPAQAEPQPVTIDAIENPSGAIGKKVTIEPDVTASEGVKVTSERLTVFLGDKVVKNNVPKATITVRLQDTQYTVRTDVAYRVQGDDGTYGPTETDQYVQDLLVKTIYEECATVKAVDRLKTTTKPGKGDSYRTVAIDLGRPDLSPQTLTLSQYRALSKEFGGAEGKAIVREIDRRYASGYKKGTTVSYASYDLCSPGEAYVIFLRGPKDKVDRAWIADIEDEDVTIQSFRR